MTTYRTETLANADFKADQLTSEEYNLLVTLPYTRKAGYLDYVDRLSGKYFPEGLNDILDKLPLIEVYDIVFSHDDFLYQDIFDGDVQFYRVYVNGFLLLIDTQGYKYGRYALFLEAEPKELEVASLTEEQTHEQIIAEKDKTIKELEETINNLIANNNKLKEFINTNF